MLTRARTNVERQDHRQWLIVGPSGTPKLVTGAAEVRDLLDQGRISADSRVYALNAPPLRLRDIPELRAAIAEPLSSEPPIRHPHWSAERARLSEELAILDRPLEDEVEYFDERPPSGGKLIKLVFVMLVVAGVGFGAFTARTDSSLRRRVGAWVGLPAATAAPAR